MQTYAHRVRSIGFFGLLIIAGCASAGTPSGREGPLELTVYAAGDSLTPTSVLECGKGELNRMGYRDDQQGELTYFWKGGLPRREIVLGPIGSRGFAGLWMSIRTLNPSILGPTQGAPTVEGEAEAREVIAICLPEEPAG